VPTVVSVRPHDTGAFTQGLILYDGSLFESTGNRGDSTLREVDPMTGAVKRSINLADSDFAEGLARVGNTLIQLTWQQQHALVYDLATFEQTGSHDYTGEGWGLCYDGSRLVMSDGTSTLTFRDPSTFASIGSVQVTLDGQPVKWLNELECVSTSVYANVWWSNSILRIDPATGVVATVIDASGLLTPQEAASANVLNGIAYDPTTGHFLVTGKYWPKLFELDFSPQRGDPAQGGDPRTSATVSSGRGCSAGGASSCPLALGLGLAWSRRRRRTRRAG
jgi:glutaminyl-peptide cyclotransferase